jgi:tRNA(Leu) C34 or U34 (ribose-2'-O)-methylase TrmL
MNARVVLVNPKFPENLGQAVRACANFGVPEMVWTGNRFDLSCQPRIPRELRLREYNEWVRHFYHPKPLDLYPGFTPVCVEVGRDHEDVQWFHHPADAVYVFGPEDGSVPQVMRRLCHRFVAIPSIFCLNLAAAVNITLYDRMTKLKSQKENS